MDQLSQPPQIPKYTQEKLTKYLKETNEALSAMTTVLINGFEESSDIYKPWPKAKIEKILSSIVSLLKSKIIYYERAEELEKAQKTETIVEELKKAFSAIEKDKEVPESFLQTVQQAIESDLKS